MKYHLFLPLNINLYRLQFDPIFLYWVVLSSKCVVTVVIGFYRLGEALILYNYIF